MRTESIKFHISPYGSVSSAVRTLVDRGALQRRWLRSFSRQTISGKGHPLFHVWLAFSQEMDEAFVKDFRQHSTPETRLLVMNEVEERQPGVSTDTLFTRLLDLQIRSPHRVCVVDCKFGSGKTAIAGVLLKRLVSALTSEDNSNRILDAKIEAGVLRVVSPDFRRLDVPVSQISSLANADSDVLIDIEIDEDGAFVYWPKLDVHLGWEQLEQIVHPEAVRKAQQKNREFNVRYGRAVRQVREQAQLKPHDIPGISEKQLRRIEKGECRLTSNAIDALAKSHKLSPNEYMKKVAEAAQTKSQPQVP